jgi:hypothetical protein
MPEIRPIEAYADKPYDLDGLRIVADYVEFRGRDVYGDYLSGVLWPGSTWVVNKLYFSTGRVIQHPDTLTRQVFTSAAVAAIDGMRYSGAPDDEIAGLCLGVLTNKPDAFAPVDITVNPTDGQELVSEILEVEAGHNPELTNLVASVESAFMPDFDELLNGTGPDPRDYERIAVAARLGVGYGAAILHNAWDAVKDDNSLPDFPDIPHI